MSDDEQLALLWVPAPATACQRSTLPLATVPPWATSCVGEQRRHVLRGRHPTGRALGPEGETCGGCAHRRVMQWSRSYSKCVLDRAKWTKGPGSDIKVRWPACERWEGKR